MNADANAALLPAGLHDVLAPGAAHEAACVETLLRHFAGFGYRRIKPPLIEFEETLLQGSGAATARQSFRLMDPISQRMMALRADITPQVARIAASRLAGEARPLRLSYAGQVLQIRGSQLRPERQFTQVGAELVGSDAAAADAEAIVLAAGALQKLGVARLSVDITLPTLVRALAAGRGIEAEQLAAMRAALDRKDAAALAAAAPDDDPVWVSLVQASGPAEEAVAALTGLDLPAEAAAEVARLEAVLAVLRRALPDLPVTVDPVEHRGFEYQTGLSFTFFALKVRGELGRGGRYLATGDEPATGFSLFMDSVLRALPAPEEGTRVLAVAGADPDRLAELRGQGLAVLEMLEPGDIDAEARRLDCAQVFDGAALRARKESRT
jgi:ATP phosphoribosyltransferase regulatory subunit